MPARAGAGPGVDGRGPEAGAPRRPADRRGRAQRTERHRSGRGAGRQRAASPAGTRAPARRVAGGAGADAPAPPRQATPRRDVAARHADRLCQRLPEPAPIQLRLPGAIPAEPERAATGRAHQRRRPAGGRLRHPHARLPSAARLAAAHGPAPARRDARCHRGGERPLRPHRQPGRPTRRRARGAGQGQDASRRRRLALAAAGAHAAARPSAPALRPGRGAGGRGCAPGAERPRGAGAGASRDSDPRRTGRLRGGAAHAAVGSRTAR